MNKIKSIILLMASTMLLTACQDKEDGKLDNRVLAYWNFKINKDFKSAYEYLSPGWKKNENIDGYVIKMYSGKINWTGVKIIDKQCEKVNVCSVKVEITYEYQFKGAANNKIEVSTVLTENWIMKDNVWYNLPITKKM
jgi:hypothetical protein